MYEYRKMSPEEREDVVAYRRQIGLPPHEPPHFPDGTRTYLITGATYEHRPILTTEKRREEFLEKFWEKISGLKDTEVFAWVVLPNHYHILLRTDLKALKVAMKPLHNRTSTAWNREDGTKGRKVWFRFEDRHIRDEGHFFAAINYIHANPVRHGHAAKADEWKPSSFHIWLEQYGREKLIALWKGYPVLEMGRRWDD